MTFDLPVGQHGDDELAGRNRLLLLGSWVSGSRVRIEKYTAVRQPASVHGAAHAGNSVHAANQAALQTRVAVRPDYCRDVLIERF